MLRQACRAAGDGAGACAMQPQDAPSTGGGLQCSDPGDEAGRASADHWLNDGDRRGGDHAAHASNDAQLQLDSEQVKIRVLAHANKELMVCTLNRFNDLVIVEDVEYMHTNVASYALRHQSLLL